MSSHGSFYWSIRRELWENRSVWIAPLAMAALILAGFVFAAGKWTALLSELPSLHPNNRMRVIFGPYGLSASVIVIVGWLVGVFYALDALNGERRDRSILFWKSMPVSDLTTVLAKAAIPLVIVPLVALAVAFATQFLMLVASSAIFASKGLDATFAWTNVPWLAASVAMIYGTLAHALWFAPIYGYLLLVSAATRRAAFLWAFLPLFAICAVEWITFGTTRFASLLGYRVTGGMTAFKRDALGEPITQFAQLDPLRFLSTPGLWLGLAFAAVCIAVAVRLRRYREPL